MQFEPNMAPVFSVIFLIFIIPLVLIIVAVKILIFCKIFSKTGYSWALGLLMLVPIANIIMLFVLAFAEWPIQRELRSFKQQNQVAS
jgi:hypothetical protein